MTKPKAIIFCGDGINSDKELAMAFEKAGFFVNRFLVNELENINLDNYQVLALAGGFSFADHLGSGKVLALKIEALLKNKLEDFLKKKKLVIGICNGFQVLAQMGLLDQEVALAKNQTKQFINRWVKVNIPTNNKSPWLTGLNGKEFYLPIRHAEGRLVAKKEAKEQVALTYLEDVNGSYQNIAGLTNKAGNILGLMPHPEAAFEDFQIPFKDKHPYAESFFTNAYEYIRSQE